MVDFRSLSSFTLATALLYFAYQPRRPAGQPVVETSQDMEKAEQMRQQAEDGAKRREAQNVLMQVQKQRQKLESEVERRAMQHAQTHLESDFAPLASATEDDEAKSQLEALKNKELQLVNFINATAVAS